MTSLVIGHRNSSGMSSSSSCFLISLIVRNILLRWPAGPNNRSKKPCYSQWILSVGKSLTSSLGYFGLSEVLRIWRNWRAWLRPSPRLEKGNRQRPRGRQLGRDQEFTDKIGTSDSYQTDSSFCFVTVMTNGELKATIAFNINPKCKTEKKSVW